MTPEKWSKVKALFDEALDLEPGEPRNRFLASIDSQASRAEVKRLLSLHEAESAIFDRLQPDLQLIRSASELRSLNAGDLIAGRFRIVRFVAEGGMGEVYEAQDEQLNERVAVKTLRFETAQDSSALARFRQEIQLARRVTHPNVCRIHDLWEHKTAGGRSIWFLTMEFLEGETLARRIERGSMPVAEVLPLVQQMAAGLGAAHEAGIVHRDFKSSNVILVPRSGSGVPDRAVVTDFGLSRSFDVRTTASGAVMGTPAYMAPEQIEGGELGPATDLYALGVVMYEMLTGMLPFRSASPMALAVKKIRETPRPPSHLVQGLPTVWDQVVMRCMQYRMDERFQTAAAVMEAIETGKLPSLRGPDLQLRVPARWWKLALVVILVAVGVGYWFFGRDRGFNTTPAALKWYQDGIEKLSNGTPNRAQGLFQRALQEDSRFVAARVRLAQSLAEQDLVDAARNELLTLDTDTLGKLGKREKLLVEGVRAMALRDFQTAARQFRAQVELARGEDAADGFLDLAKAELNNENAVAAIEAANRALSKHPDFAGALLVRGQAHKLLGKSKNALADLNKAQEIFRLKADFDAEVSASMYRIAELEEVRRLKESEAETRDALGRAQALSNRVQEIRLQRQLSVLLRKARRWEESEAAAKEALAIAQRERLLVSQIEAQNDLAYLEFTQSRFGAAESKFRESLALAVASRLPYQEARTSMRLAELLFRDARVKEGHEAFVKAERYFRESGITSELFRVLRIRTDEAIAVGNNKEALELSTKYLADATAGASDSHIDAALKRLGHVAMVEGNLPRTIEYSRQADLIGRRLGLDPVRDLLNRARVQIDIGDADETKRTLKEAENAADKVSLARNARYLQIQARLAAVEGRTGTALELVDSAITKAGNDLERQETNLLKARLLIVTGQNAKALDLAQNAKEFFDSRSDVDRKVKCDCTVAEGLWASGKKREAVDLAMGAIAMGEGKAHRMSLWQCALVRRVAQSENAEALTAYSSQLQMLTANWTAEQKSKLLSRADLRQMLDAIKN